MPGASDRVSLFAQMPTLIAITSPSSHSTELSGAPSSARVRAGVSVTNFSPPTVTGSATCTVPSGSWTTTCSASLTVSLRCPATPWIARLTVPPSVCALSGRVTSCWYIRVKTPWRGALRMSCVIVALSFAIEAPIDGNPVTT